MRQKAAGRQEAAGWLFVQVGGDVVQVFEKDFHVAVAVFFGSGAQDGGGVEGCEDGRQAYDLLEFAMGFGDFEACSQEGLGGYGAEADDEIGLHGFELGFQPGAAGSDLQHVWLLVNAELASGFPLEVFDGVGDVDPGAVDAGVFQAFVQELAGWAYEGTALLVFLIAGLFADHHDLHAGPGVEGAGFELAKDGLGRVPKEVATLAALDGFAEGGEASGFRDEGGGGGFGGCGHTG